jgi:ATP-dependent DNA helicase RecG
MTENQYTEWKESWRDDCLRWICGFANAEGGVLVIGRNDQGQVVGLPDARRLLEELPSKIRDLLGIVVEVNLRRKALRDYVELVTPAYPNPISYRGHYYQRSGSTLQELKGAALDRFLLRRYGRTWDCSPVPGVAVADLSPAALSRFRSLAARSGRLEAAALAEGDAGVLGKLKLTRGRLSQARRRAVVRRGPAHVRHRRVRQARLLSIRVRSGLQRRDRRRPVPAGAADAGSAVHQVPQGRRDL